MIEERITVTGLVKLLEQVDWIKLPKPQQDLGVRYLCEHFCISYQPTKDDKYYFRTIDNDIQKISQNNPYITFIPMSYMIVDIFEIYKLSNEETKTDLLIIQ